jgi:L-ascorbate metabolism protein UlaG (beta-lactamase superfamily)
LGLLAGAALLWSHAAEALGGSVAGARLARAQASPQWQYRHFDNRLARVDGPVFRALTAFLFEGSPYRTPEQPVPITRRTQADYQTAPASGLRITWLGHSTLFVEIDGKRLLIDPVWGERASPLTFAGPKRFFAPPLPLDDLPGIDAVVISHDHYDHLDLPTVKALARRGVHWLVPLGVGAHLDAWGIPGWLITELDWWETVTIAGLTVVATPARHFSGRGLFDANHTLWAGWAFIGPTHRVFYSGDTALHDEFAEIGRRFGPFDVTMIEVGAYDPLWADVHLGPEQAVLAHQLVRGALMLPVHWGMFDLALHGWTEPIERVLACAQSAGVRVATPRPGDMIEPARVGLSARWWPEVPWDNAEQKPVQSSGMQSLRTSEGPWLTTHSDRREGVTAATLSSVQTPWCRAPVAPVPPRGRAP